MNAQEIIRFIQEAEKTTPVKVYYQAKEAIDFPNCHVFGPVVFGDWKEIAPVLEAHREVITDLVVENDRRNSAVPLLDIKTSTPASNRVRSSAIRWRSANGR